MHSSTILLFMIASAIATVKCTALMESPVLSSASKHSLRRVSCSTISCAFESSDKIVERHLASSFEEMDMDVHFENERDTNELAAVDSTENTATTSSLEMGLEIEKQANVQDLNPVLTAIVECAETGKDCTEVQALVRDLEDQLEKIASSYY